MADNVVANAGAGGATFAADDIGGVHYPRAKVGWGADGAFNDTSAAAPLPVVQTGTPALPTGAATAAKQPALGTAGTASADVISVQGIASMTPLLVNGSANAQPVTDNGGTLSIDDGAGSLTVDGTVTVQDGGGAISIDDNAGSLTVDAPVGTPVFVRLSDGASAIATLPVSLASVPSHAVTNAGTFATQAAQSGTWTVQPGNTANTTAWLVSSRPAAAGGHSIYRLISAATTNAASVKASAGQVYGGIITNINAAARYLKIYNLAASPTVGTSTPVITLAIPGNTAGAGLTFTVPNGIAFDTGISIAITTGAADSDTGAVALAEIIVNLFYT